VVWDLKPQPDGTLPGLTNRVRRRTGPPQTGQSKDPIPRLTLK